MKEFTDNIFLSATDSLKYFSESALFYDIETTGFSAKYNKIYFIGCAYRKKEQLVITQFFSESADDEADVLTSFLLLCRCFTTAITFNGLGFDLPFIQERCKKLHISEQLSGMEHFDIYRKISPYKKILKLSGMKQKSIEQFLDLYREDKFSGGELIQVYHDYLANRNEEGLTLLLSHNKEDVLGMMEILPILAYDKLFQGFFEVSHYKINSYQEYDGSKALEIIFTLQLQYTVPKGISYSNGDIFLKAYDNTANLRIKGYHGELKYFYPNYKDYYYLPQEDMAIHKSVAAYVDKDFREKAKASTCYTKKTGVFLPQYDMIYSPSFKFEHTKTLSYFELTDDFMNTKELQKNYILHILPILLS